MITTPIITVSNKQDLFGLNSIPSNQIVFVISNNAFYHLIDWSRRNKNDGWKTIGGSGTLSGNVVNIGGGGSSDLYVKYQASFSGDPTYAPTQIIYGDIEIKGNITASGEVSAFAASAPASWWTSMPIASTTVLGGIKVGANLTIDVNGVLNAAGGAGTAAWGSISGTLSDQTDLNTAIGLLAPKASPTFTGTVSGITAAMVGLSNVTNNAQWYSGNHPTTKAGYGITDVPSIEPTPSGNQVAIWHSTGSIKGLAGLVYDGTTLTVIGNITATGEISAFSASVPSTWWDSMPYATTSTVGGIIVGTGLTIVAGVLSATSGSGGMVYPDAGIALSTSSSWEASITNNSSNWNTAYSWGNHGAVGYLVAITKGQVEAVLTGTITSHNHSGVYEPFITKATGYLKWTGTAWTFLNQSYSLSGHTHDTLAMANFTILQESGKITFKYGSTIIATISSAGYLKTKDEIESFVTTS